MKKIILYAWALCAGLVAGSLPNARAADIPPEVRGLGHYRMFCANCHGLAARGDGPLVPLLKITPTDLTLLAQQAGGGFDAERVFKAIDGRHQVSGGGEKRMPVFSESLEVRTIIELLEYLKTIQR
jgi:hypothetical protein